MINILNDNKEMLNKIPNLTKRCEIMSNEEIGSYISSVASYFTNKLTDIKNVFTSNTNSVKNDDVTAILKDMIDMKKDMLYIMEHIKYSEYISVKIPSMLGLKLNLPDAISELLIMIKLVDDNILDILNNLDTTISKVMSDSNYGLSTRPKIGKVSITDINIAIEVGISNIIDNNGTRDTYKLSELVPNLNSLNLIYDDIIKMSKGTGLNNINVVKNMSDKIGDKIDTLHDMLARNKDVTISKSVINELGYELENTAMLVSNYVSIIYIYNQIIATYINIIKRLRTSIV